MEKSKIFKFFSFYYLNFILIITAIGTLFSMYLSEFEDLPPCDLCWYQRIFFYPIFFITLVALIRKDSKAYVYLLPLAIIGLPISIYHHLLKVTTLFPKETIFCGEAGSCSAVDWELIQGSGITLPFLAGLGFISVIILSSIAFWSNRNN